MANGSSIIKLDKTGFPLICLGDFYISLFPVSKYQFEKFLSGFGCKGEMFTQTWYKEVLDINSRIVWWDKDAFKNTPWNLFITGLYKNEIDVFISYMGNEYQLPDVCQWKLLLDFEKEKNQQKQKIIEELSRMNAAKPSIFWVENNMFPLAEEGLWEMTIDKGRLCGIGKPWQKFQPNSWKPDDARGIMNDNDRIKYLGFRLLVSNKSKILKRPENFQL